MDLNDLIDGAIEEDEGERAECSLCGGMGTYMGTLGNLDLDHYRCRDCGIEYSRDSRGG